MVTKSLKSKQMKKSVFKSYIFFFTVEAVFLMQITHIMQGFPGGTRGKESSSNEGDQETKRWIPELGKSFGVGSGNLLQNSCLEKFHGQRSLESYHP